MDTAPLGVEKRTRGGGEAPRQRRRRSQRRSQCIFTAFLRFFLFFFFFFSFTTFSLSLSLSSFLSKGRRHSAFHRNRDKTPKRRRFVGALASRGSASDAVS